ncbi:hypothetical protein A3860_32855 [Niastella vici]|uniref:Uncharacterized protein n=1 Tax=Niastella vici TaxID=1703345 RepID=A0A1V9FQS8_9BACT|nr:hypothetical protein A3860_32855 [Niastella vici]
MIEFKGLESVVKSAFVTIEIVPAASKYFYSKTPHVLFLLNIIALYPKKRRKIPNPTLQSMFQSENEAVVHKIGHYCLPSYLWI